MIDSYIKDLLSLINRERDYEREAMLKEIRDLTADERERKGRAVNNLSGKFIKKRIKQTYCKIFKIKRY